MASLIKQIASQQLNAISRKDERKNAKATTGAFKRFNQDTSIISTTGTMKRNSRIKYNLMRLDQEFVLSFLKDYAETSLLRNINTLGTFTPPASSSTVNPLSSHAKIQHEITMISAQLTTDIITLSIRTNLPMTLIKREYIRYKRRKRMQSLPKPKLQQIRVKYPPPPIKNESCLTGKVNGLPNYSSTCFLNSVLQALASATPFIRYLERIVWLEETGMMMNPHSRSQSFLSAGSSSMGIFAIKQPLSKLVLEVLMHVNAEKGYEDRSGIHRKIRQILDRIASENEQFKSYKYHHSKEQQDAQELLQALVAIIIDESEVEEPFDGDQEVLNDVIKDGDKDEDEASAVKKQLGESSLFSVDELYEESNQAIMLQMASLPDATDESSDNGILIIEEERLSHHIQSKAMPTGVTECSVVLETSKEEKKEEEADDKYISQNQATCELESQVIENTEILNKPKRKCNLSQSMMMMIENLSSKTPSPLSGCIGSRLECCECHHVKPIHDSPFLEIPVVPTDISYPSTTQSSAQCSLVECLKEFTEVEIVQGVNCRACSIQAELKSLEEEKLILRDAMDSILTRGSDKSEVLSLKQELEGIFHRCDFLKSIDPDEDIDCDEEHWDDILYSQKSIPTPRKVDHEKRLTVTRLPPILCLHVKRLYFNPGTNQMAKSSQHIIFQEYLSMKDLHADNNEEDSGNVALQIQTSEVTPHRCDYVLVSVIEHLGSAFSGHYVTYRRIKDRSFSNALSSSCESVWALISDERVSYISWNTLRQCNAYMLVYEAV